jgi:transcriptional regulator with XRE-family HTH domain
MILKTYTIFIFFSTIVLNVIILYFCCCKYHYFMKIAEKIKLFRTSKNLSQKEVAVLIGIDQAQYSRIESGKVEPTLSSLEKIAEALGVKIPDFFTEENHLDVNSYDKNLIDKLRLIEELEENEKKSIFSIIDIAITKKRLTDTLSNALKFAH